MEYEGAFLFAYLPSSKIADGILLFFITNLEINIFHNFDNVCSTLLQSLSKRDDNGVQPYMYLY